MTKPRADRLDQLRRERNQLEQMIRLAVKDARLSGMSWAEIGEGLGVSKQAAQQRYGQ